jgi:hypothetical protein
MSLADGASWVLDSGCDAVATVMALLEAAKMSRHAGYTHDGGAAESNCTAAKPYTL